MALYIPAVDLVRILRDVKPFSGSRIKRILNYVKINSHGSFLATDVDAFASVDCPTWARDSHGTQVDGLIQPFLLPLKESLAFASKLPKTAMIRVDVDGLRVELAADDNRVAFVSESPDEFPDVPRFQATAVCDIFDGALSRALTATEYCADYESTRFALGAILLDLGKDESNVIATDGRRMAVANLTERVNFYYGERQEFMLPGKYAIATAKLLAGRDLMLYRLETSETACNMIQLTDGDGLEITLRLCEGRYPRWREVMRCESHSYLATFDGKKLFDALKTFQVSDECRGADFTFSDGRLSVRSDRASTAVSAYRYNRNIETACETTLDVEYVREFAKRHSAKSDEVDIAFKDEESAVFLFATNVRYILMPMNKPKPKPAETETAETPAESAPVAC